MKKGVNAVGFGEPGWRLGYAKDAIGSYFIFKTLRNESVIPKDVRFQVALPITNSSIEFFFDDPIDYPRIKPGFVAALRAEIAKMLKYIPAADLAIQWDCCIELMDLEGDIPWAPKENKLERHLSQIPEVTAQIPETVMLGYHLCYGTLGGWPMATGPGPQSRCGVRQWRSRAFRAPGRFRSYPDPGNHRGALLCAAQGSEGWQCRYLPRRGPRSPRQGGLHPAAQHGGKNSCPSLGWQRPAVLAAISRISCQTS